MRVASRVLLIVISAVFLMAALPVVVLIAFGVGLVRLTRWCELSAIYDGDTKARDRDEWKCT